MSPKKQRKTYHQWCPVATALDLVGDRWTLLIIRDLLSRDRRFSELRSELSGISPTLLSTRLRDLASDGLIVQTGNRYSLTEHGRSLDQVVYALGAWGAASTDVPKRLDQVPQDYRITGLYSMIRKDRIGDTPLVAELAIDGETVVVTTTCDAQGRDVVVESGEADDPSVRVVATMMGLFSLQTGRAAPEDAQRAGTVRVSGDADSAKNFLNLILPESR